MIAINPLCPNSEKPVEPDGLTHYRGAVVGFCNPGCRDTFANAVDLFDEFIDKKGGGALRAAFIRHARYNQWMNQRLISCLVALPEDRLTENLGAFFGSILGTLNHLMVWDIVWLQRFSTVTDRDQVLAWVSNQPTPISHDQVLHATLGDLSSARSKLDKTLLSYVETLCENDFDTVLTYTLQSGRQMRKHFAGVMQHLFNHQTHHRGQLTTLLTQMGVETPETDLLLTFDEAAL